MKKSLIFILLFSFFNLLFSEVPSKAKIFVQLGHGNEMTDFKISPDQLYYASIGNDKTIKIWDIETGRILKTLSGDEYKFTAFNYSKDGSLIASGNYEGEIKIWDIKTGQAVNKFKYENREISGLDFSNDSKKIVFSQMNETDSKIIDVSNGKILSVIPNNYAFNDVYFSNDNKRIILCGSNTRIYDLEKNKIISEISENAEHAFFLKDSNKVLCWGDKIFIFDIKENKISLQINSSSYGASITHDEKIIAATDYTKDIYLYDAASGKLIKKFPGNEDRFTSMKFISNNKLITQDGKSMYLYDISAGKQLKTLTSNSSIAYSIAISKDGKYLAGGYADKTVRVWDIQEGSLYKSYEGSQNEVVDVAFSNNDETIASSSKEILFFNRASGKITSRISDNWYSGRGLAFSNDDRYLFSGWLNNTIRLYDLKTERVVREYTGHQAAINALAISPDQKNIVTASSDYSFKLWATNSKEEITTIKYHKDDVTGAVFSPDSETLYTAGYDGKIVSWQNDRAFGNITLKKETVKGKVSNLGISPDGKILASGHYDSTITLWNSETLQELRTLSGHTSTIKKLLFTPDGRFLISCSSDSTIKIWNVNTGKEILMLCGFSNGEWIAVTPEGYFDASKEGAKFLNVELNGSYFSVDNYTETFYRPLIIKNVLNGKSISSLTTINDAKPAPTLTITNYKKINEDTVELSVLVKDNGGGIGDLRIYQNKCAVLLEDTRGLLKTSSKSDIKNYKIKLASGENEIVVIAFNRDNSMQSNESKVTIDASDKQKKPDLYALIIGINEYNNKDLTLKYAYSDAELIGETLKTTTVDLYKTINMQILITKDSTAKKNILNELTKYKNINADDLFIFYIASHGIVDEGEYFMLSSNVGSTSSEKLKQEAISQNELKTLLSNIPASKKLIIIDTCQSQALGDALQSAFLTRGLDDSSAIKLLSRATGVTILSASKSNQFAIEGYHDHGLFTYILSEGLKGKADFNKDGFVKTLEIADYLDNEVPKISEDVFKLPQYPIVSPNGQAFPITKSKN